MSSPIFSEPASLIFIGMTLTFSVAMMIVSVRDALHR